MLLPGLVILTLLAARWLGLPEGFGVSAAWLLLVIMPGILILECVPELRCQEQISFGILDRWLESTAIGVLCLSIWLGISDAIRIPLDLAIIVYGGAGVVVWWYTGPSINWQVKKVSWEILLVGAIIAVSVIRILSLPYVTSASSDLLAHLDGIRQVRFTGEVFPHMLSTDGMAGVKPDPRFGTWHGMVEGIWYLGASSLQGAWTCAAAWMVGPILLASERLGREIFRNVKAGVVCLVVYLLLMSTVEGDLLSMSALPSVVARCIFGVVLIWCLRGLDGVGGARWYWSLAVAAAGLALFRLDYFMMVGAVLGILACAGILGFIGEGRWLWTKRLGIWICGAVPLLAYKYSISLPTPPGYLSQFRAGVLLLGSKWWMTDIFRFGPTIFILLVMGLIWLVRARHTLTRSSWLLLTVLTIGGLQAFNPLFCRLFEPIVSAPYIVRLARLVPIYLLVTGVLLDSTGFRIWAKPSKRRPLVAGLALGLIGVSVIPELPGWLQRPTVSENSVLESGMTNWLRDHAEVDTTVLASPIVAYCIAGLTDLKVVAVPPSHASPWVTDAKQRERDAYRALSDCTSLVDRMSILRKYGANWVLFREEPGVADDWGASQVLHEDHELVLLSVDPAHGSAEGEGRVCGSTSLPNQANIRPISLEQGLEAYVAWPDTLEGTRGAILELPVVWRPNNPIMEKKIWALRFESGYPRSFLYSPVWSKPYRKLEELLTGRRYRFRVQGNPCEDRPPIFIWGANRSYSDTLKVRIPADVHDGYYRVQLKVVTDSFMRNHRPRDYFSDRDLWTGQDCGVVLSIQNE